MIENIQITAFDCIEGSKTPTRHTKMPMDHGMLENIPQTIFRGKGGGSVGLVVGGAELQPVGTEVVVSTSSVSAEGPRTFSEQLLRASSVGSVLSGAELQPSGTKVVVPGSGVSAEGPRTLMEGVKTETCKVDGT